MLMKRRRKIIPPQFFSFTRRVPKGKYKKTYKIIDTHFGRVREVRHIKPVISKYG